jgi:hypothetical protein
MELGGGGSRSRTQVQRRAIIALVKSSGCCDVHCVAARNAIAEIKVLLMEITFKQF